MLFGAVFGTNMPEDLESAPKRLLAQAHLSVFFYGFAEKHAGRVKRAGSSRSELQCASESQEKAQLFVATVWSQK